MNTQLPPVCGQSLGMFAAFVCQSAIKSLIRHGTLRAGQCLFESGQDVGWDQRRFAAPAHQQFSMFYDGEPALEASWSHPTLKMAMALERSQLIW